MKEVEFVKLKLENAVGAAVADYNIPEKCETMPRSIHNFAVLWRILFVYPTHLIRKHLVFIRTRGVYCSFSSYILWDVWGNQNVRKPA